MDCSSIIEVREVDSVEEMNSLLAMEDQDWVLLGVSSGQREDKTPCFLYSLGKSFRLFDSDLPGQQW